MDEKFKKLITNLQKIRLEPEEKQELRKRLKQETTSSEITRTISMFSWWRVQVGAIILFLTISSGGAISARAERALPGDFLYPVKTKVNEPVARIFTKNQKSLAKLETKLLEKRLVEAEKVIINQKELNSVQKESIRNTLTKQTNRAAAEAAKVIIEEEKKVVETQKPTIETKMVATKIKPDEVTTLSGLTTITQETQSLENVSLPTSTATSSEGPTKARTTEPIEEIGQLLEKHQEVIRFVSDINQKN